MSSVHADSPPQPPAKNVPQLPDDLPQSLREETPQSPGEEPQSSAEEPTQPPARKPKLVRLDDPAKQGQFCETKLSEPNKKVEIHARFPYIAAMFKNLGSKPSLRGSGHVILNAIRPCNVITLLAIAIVCWIMIVMTGIHGTFFFFDAASHFFTSLIALTLILTELSLLKSYFRRVWPVFSDEHGLTWLGTAMVVMGCQVLGNLNDGAIAPSKIGRPIYSLVLATGILALTFGAVNITTSLLFADRKAGVNARMIRSDGNLASPRDADGSESVHKEKDGGAKDRWTKRLTLAGARRLKISRPIPQQPEDVEAQFQSDTWRDSRSSPIIPEVRRPDTAMHPLNTGVSRYSEVTHLPRF